MAARRSQRLYRILALTGWFDITDVASLLPLFEEQISAPVTRFGFENDPDQRLALAFAHGFLGDLGAAHGELFGVGRRPAWCRTVR